MQQNIQAELNFSSTSAGEAREAGREETESLSTAKDPESPASTNRLMEEVCERENLGLTESLLRDMKNLRAGDESCLSVEAFLGWTCRHQEGYMDARLNCGRVSGFERVRFSGLPFDRRRPDGR